MGISVNVPEFAKRLLFFCSLWAYVTELTLEQHSKTKWFQVIPYTTNIKNLERIVILN